MSGLVHDHKASYYQKSAHANIVLPELPVSSSSANADSSSRSKSKKKKEKFKEKNKTRKKRSKSSPAGPHRSTSPKDKEYLTRLTKIHEDGTQGGGERPFGGDRDNACRLPSIMENPRKFTDKYSTACSSGANSDIDTLFRDKLNIGSTPSGDRTRRAMQMFERSRRETINSCEKSQNKSEEKKKQKKATLLVSIKPENQDSEMEKFMKSNFSQNPIFEYKYVLNTGALDRFKKASDELIPVAIKIMKNVLRKFGSYENFEDSTGGRRLTHAEIAKAAHDYLTDEDLEDDVEVKLSEDLVSRACMTRIKGQPTLQVRVVNIREKWMEGLLRHEIGTHYLRSYNNSKQPWGRSKRRKKYDLRPLNPTEEGLASLHSVIYRNNPCLYRSALLYYTAYQASQMSFAELFRDIGKFVKDSATRWNYCLRAKRGQVDTSKPGAFCKDQVYLKGAMQILKHRKEINFHHLVQCGKVDYRDVEKLSDYADFETTRVPAFMEDTRVYRAALDDIVAKNGLTDDDFSQVS